jgi:ppGpp synthetase/RelA/SpoT-type nucleotidyltranferase
MSSITDKTEREYDRAQRLADLVLADLRKRIGEAVGALGDPYLVRAKLADQRIKTRSSLTRKARQQGWTFSETLSKAQDVIGLRLVCHNLQDVRRVADLLEAALAASKLQVRRDDYTMKPRESGYRAIHLILFVDVRMGKEHARIGCEIQIRSLLQNAWAELSRADIYAGEAPVPKSIERRMVALSKLLARADETANRIRVDLAKPRRGRRPQAGQQLTAPTLAFIYRRHFGQDPPEYLIQAVLREVENQPLRSDGLEAALQDEAFVAQLKAAYSATSGFDWEPDTTYIFLWVALSLFGGKDASLRRARHEGRLERQEIESIAAREALGDFPSLEAVLRSLEYAQKDEDPESDIRSWACNLGVTNRCTICGTTIIDPEELARALVKHFKLRGYRARGMRERLTEAIQSRSSETGSWYSSTTCSYCAYSFERF